MNAPLLPRNIPFTRIVEKGTPPQPYDRKHKRNYLCDDGVWRSIRDIRRHTRISENTLYTRISKYGLTSLLILVPGQISKMKIDLLEPEMMDAYLENFDGVFNKPTPPWNRKDCRRGGINCANYSDCQAQRCGLAGYPEWQHRDNTDECYIDPAPEQILRGMDTTKLAQWGF